MRISEEVLGLAKQGDLKAFEKIFYTYINYLAGFADIFILDKFAIEDIVMEVMEYVFLNLKTEFDESKAGFETWIFSLVRYKALQYNKITKERNEVPLSIAIELGKDAFYIDQDAITFDELKNILDEDEYKVIFLRFVVGLKVYEISEILNYSDSKIKRISAKAFAKTRNFLQK